ncbi:MAG TPA: tetraacyldisaccharide 4'-kinase [Chitinophagaceae bacterium]|nr:tetraacyldisaccharide 4'-kinase [Chitinophagaceae bacterium]
MNSNFFLKSFRILLFPLAIIYWLLIAIRNTLYDKNILSSSSFGMPLICVGNLAVGGTGKSPMVEYMVKNLKDDFKVATLSRGYKRKTKGYAMANEFSNALEIGDEPMQFYLKFPDVPVAVGEERLEAIPQLLHDKPETQCIILDDAFQHRAIKAGLNILLTDCNNLFIHDFYLPTGDLRDLKSGYKRAEMIIVTKCDPGLSLQKKKEITEDIHLLPHQHIFFTANKYTDPYKITDRKETIRLHSGMDVLLVTGIANPLAMKDLMKDTVGTYYLQHFPDHYIFSIDDWKEIKKRFDEIENNNKIILTTEKDAVRLVKFGEEISQAPLYVLPLEHHFLFDEQEIFLTMIKAFIQNFKPGNKN